MESEKNNFYRIWEEIEKDKTRKFGDTNNDDAGNLLEINGTNVIWNNKILRENDQEKELLEINGTQVQWNNELLGENEHEENQSYINEGVGENANGRDILEIDGTHVRWKSSEDSDETAQQREILEIQGNQVLWNNDALNKQVKEETALDRTVASPLKDSGPLTNGVRAEKQEEAVQWKVTEVQLVSHATEETRPSVGWRVVKTIFLVIVWVSIGLCGEITGPTLLDLKLKTNSNYEDVSSGVSGRSAGFFVGSAIGGVLVDKLGLYCDVLVALGLNGEAATTAAIAWMPNTNMIFLMTFLQGTSEGVINIAGQKMIIEMWLEKAAGPMHLLHGGFGIGSFIIPLVANPFLAVTDIIKDNITAVENVTLMPGVTTTTNIPTSTEVVIKESRMEYPYCIAAAFAVLVSLVFYGYQMAGGSYRRKQKQIREQVGQEKSDKRALSFKEMINPATCAGGKFFYGVQLFTLIFLYFTQIVGGERVAGKFVRAYAIKHVGFSDSDGSYINTVFWIAFAIGRCSGLITAHFIPIRLLVMLETGGCLVTSVLLVIFGGNATALWILMASLGFFVAPLFPSGVGWGNYHVEMTGVAITFCMLGGSVGGVASMRIIGYLLDHYGYKMFLYTILWFGVASFVLAGLMNLVGGRHGGRFEAEREKTTDVDDEEIGKDYAIENKAYKHD